MNATTPLRLLIALTPTAVLVGMGFQRRWVAEDAFITFRVIANLLEGHGPVFNVGERVEAYTHPLWLALLTLLTSLGIRIELGAVFFGLLFSTIGLLVAQHGAAKLWKRFEPPSMAKHYSIDLPVGAAVFAATPVVWDFVTSGLETGLTFAWMGISFWLLVRIILADSKTRSESRDAIPFARLALPGAVLSLAPLIRPDLTIFSLISLIGLFAATKLRLKHHWHKLLGCGLAWLFLPACYQIFRMGYFACLVPNTALVKEAAMPNWPQGAIYFLDFVNTYALWVPALLLGLHLISHLPPIRRSAHSDAAITLLAPLAAAALHALWVMRIGGDFMHGRLLLPAYFSALLPVMTVMVPRGAGFSWSRLAAIMVLGWCLFCAAFFRTSYTAHRSVNGIVNERDFYVYASNRSNPLWIEDYAGFYWHEDGRLLREIAHQYDGDIAQRPLFVEFSSYHKGAGQTAPLAAHLPPNIALAARLYAVGMSGYVAGSKVWIVDRMGLADPLGSRMQIIQRGRPGHEKHLPREWTIARLAQSSPEDSQEVQAARRALQCGDLRQLLQAIQEPLTWSRFACNLRLSFRLTGLRIPPEPLAAEKLFCQGHRLADR